MPKYVLRSTKGSSVTVFRRSSINLDTNSSLMDSCTINLLAPEQHCPAFLDNCTKDMDICNDMEIFGPVFPVFTFKTLDEAIEIAETSEYGLSAGVITENLKDAMKVAASLQTGMVAVNGSGGFRAQELPFGGGKKMSGNSRECMSSVLEEVTQEKSIIFRYAMKKYNET